MYPGEPVSSAPIAEKRFEVRESVTYPQAILGLIEPGMFREWDEVILLGFLRRPHE